jgi:hypothetical protein
VKSIQTDMNVARQRRKFDQAIADAPSEWHARYLAGLRDEFDRGIECGEPQPFSQFYPLYQEEFDL